MSKLTVFDAIVAVILSISLFFSLFKGMIREIFALVGYAGGYLVAVKYQDSFAQTLMSSVGNKTVAGIISFAVLFFSIVLVLSLIGKVVRGYLTAAPGLSWVDRLMGGVIGVLKGVVILVILIFPLKFFPDFYREVTKDSFFAPHLRETSNQVSQLVSNRKLFDWIPKFYLDGVEDQFKMKELNKLSKEMESLKDLIPMPGKKPYDTYSEEDKKQLDKILQSIEKK